MVDRRRCAGKGLYRANGGGPDVVTLRVQKVTETNRSKLTRNGAVVQPRLRHAWRRMKRFCCNGFVFARIAGRCSSFARTATVAIGIAASPAAVGRGVSSAGARTSAINAAWKGVSITATGSANIVPANAPSARA